MVFLQSHQVTVEIRNVNTSEKLGFDDILFFEKLADG